MYEKADLANLQNLIGTKRAITLPIKDNILFIFSILLY